MARKTKNNVFLTGADGFLGSNIARELLAQGYHVKAYIQSGRVPRTIQDLPDIDICYGDLLNERALKEAMKGCRYLIHAAANTSVFPSRSEIVRQVNIDGTRNVIKSALAVGIARAVFVSSAAVFGSGSIDKPGDETRPYAAAHIGLDYMDSKAQAHYEVVAAVKTCHLPAVLVCPTFMLGPYDSKPSSGAMIAALYAGKLPGYTGAGRNYVHVQDVAKATVNALRVGQIGAAYIVGNKNMSYGEAFTTMARVLNVKKPKWRLPDWVILAYGFISSLAYRLFGIQPVLSYEMARNGCAEMYYSPEKAVKELGLPQTPIEKAVADSFEWLKSNHLLSEK